MQAIAWWKEPDSEIRKAVPLLLSEDVAALVSYGTKRP